ncbi:unnamed protein product, partial [Mesorhabditis belari]|uniref:Uncharacterized protein n=1 Tax=Mesorhabditis belari TaxID=2138241 RepID=A0AAF3J377_9BILA
MGEERYRLVVLGSAKVGKTSLIRQYLYKEFSAKYKETIEDLHSRQFRIQGVPLPLDILDTNFNFPDMRRLAISTASAFLLVFSVDDVQTFKEMSDLWQEICDRRPDISLLPTVVVGNKCDLPTKKIFEATATAFTNRLSGDVRYLEVSAKSNIRVTEIFRTLLEISGFPRCKIPSISRTLKASGGPLEDLNEGKDEDSPVLRRHNTARERPTNRQIFSQKQELREFESPLKENPPLNHQSSHPVLSVADRLLANNGDLKRHRSLRMKSPRREKETLEKKALDDSETKPLSRSGSLIRRTKHLSLKMRRHGEKQEPMVDESDCRIQ